MFWMQDAFVIPAHGMFITNSSILILWPTVIIIIIFISYHHLCRKHSNEMQSFYSMEDAICIVYNVRQSEIESRQSEQSVAAQAKAVNIFKANHVIRPYLSTKFPFF